MGDGGGRLGWWLVGLALAAWAVGKAAVALVWRPLVVTRSFAEQGVRGPPYRFIWGSIREMKSLNSAAATEVLDPGSHDIPRVVVPYYHRWFLQYGQPFLYWMGTQPRIFISDPEMVKQVLSKFSFFPKETPRPSVTALLGKGLVLAEGVDWVRHRRVVSPAFAMDKIKLLTATMADCTAAMIDGWEAQLAGEEDACKEIEMESQFMNLTATIICRAAFGVAGDDGEKVFQAQRKLQHLAMATTFDLPLPGARYLPTMGNLRMWRQDRRLKKLLSEIIRRRAAGGAASHGNDLLGTMMDACRDDKGNGLSLSLDEIMDECKTFFFAGHETTAYLLTWTMFLLSTHPDWQDKLRQEALAVCGPASIPDADRLAGLKLTAMVLQESARLYTPVPVVPVRQAAQDMEIEGLKIPKGTSITVALPIVHRSAAVWGADAGDFNPLRFRGGVSCAAAHPNAMLSFSVGPRSCVGRDFAMVEAKLAVAMILRRFTFSLSPGYRHAPERYVTLRPKFGLPLIVRTFTP